MTTLTETTTLDEVLFNAEAGTVQVTWRDHIYRDGCEVDAYRTARTKTYTVADAEAFAADLGSDASKYASLLQAVSQ